MKSTQQATNYETNAYLRKTAYEFPVESEITMDESEEIYLRIQDNPQAHPYTRIFEL